MLRARYYDPAVGKWISEDPIGFAAGDSNLARYVGNSSPNHSDPSGLEEEVGFAPPFSVWEADRDAFVSGGFGTEGDFGGFGEASSSGLSWQDIGERVIFAGGTTLIAGPVAGLAVAVNGVDFEDVSTMASQPAASAQGGAQGAVMDGGAMLLNALTFQAYAPLNDHVNQLVEENGTPYRIANVAANIGVSAALAATPAGAAALFPRYAQAGLWTGRLLVGVDMAVSSNDVRAGIAGRDPVRAGMGVVSLGLSMVGLRQGAGGGISGLSRTQAAELRARLMAIPGVKYFRAFGSRTVGTSTAASDLDVILIGEIDTTSKPAIDAMRAARDYAKSIGIGPGKGGQYVDPTIFPTMRSARSSVNWRPVPNPKDRVPIFKDLR